MDKLSRRLSIMSILAFWCLLPLAAETPRLAAQAAPELSGDGVLVAIIGSGIDYGHAHLGGDGSSDAFLANDPGVIEPGSFPTARIVGGYDLAGAFYSAACPEVPAPDMGCHKDPRPDADPLDLVNGIGTRMAGIVAGEATADLPAGVAPDARLVALKVHGNPSGVPRTSSLYDEAIDWVIRHNDGESMPGAPADGARIDVILLEAGEAFGRDLADLEAAAAEASAEGITLIAAAGDSGGQPFTVSGTAAPRDVLSVAAAVSTAPSSWGIRVSYPLESGELTTVPLEAVEGGAWLPQLEDVGPVSGAMAWYGLACNDDQGNPPPPVQEVDEKIALIARGECAFTDKMVNAAAFGASAVVMFTDQRNKIGPACGGGGCPAPAIPGVMIDNTPGLELQAKLESSIPVSATLDANYIISQDWLVGTLLASASAGPAPDGGPGVDLVSEGVEIPVALAGSGDGSFEWSSSGAAAADVAARAALTVERARAAGWRETSLDRPVVQALLASHADPTTYIGRNDGDAVAPSSRQGAGRADHDGSATGSTIAHPPDGLGIGFGVVRISGPRQLATSVLLRRLGDAPISLRGRFDFARPGEDGDAGMVVRLDQERVELDDRNFIEVAVNLSLDAASLRAWDIAAGSGLSVPTALDLHEIGGHLRFAESDRDGTPKPDGEQLSTAIQIIPRRSACVEPNSLPGAAVGGPTVARFENLCSTAGRMRPMMLAGSDLEETISEDPTPLRALDIRAVALRYGVVEPEDPASEGLLEFHVATAGARQSPLGTAIDVFLDIDRDGSFDRVLTTTPGSQVRDADSDLWYTVNAPLIPGTLTPDLVGATSNSLPLAYDLAEAVTVLSVSADDLLIDFESGDEAFEFGVRVRDTLNYVTTSGSLPGYDLAPDALESGARFSFDQDAFECFAMRDGAGQPIEAIAAGELELSASSGAVAVAVERRSDCRADAEDLPEGILLSYPDNADAIDQADIWRLWDEGASAPLYLPVALSTASIN